MIRVKVCGLTEPHNAREVAGCGADFAGFIFYPASKRYVGLVPPVELFSNIPPGIQKVGVFVNELLESVLEKVRKFNLQAVQLHGKEDEEYCRSLQDEGVRVIRAFGIHDGFDFAQLVRFEGCCSYFLFDTFTNLHGGSGHKFAWNLLNEYALDVPFFLSGGIGPGDLSELSRFKHRQFFAIDINSRFETAPGIKDTGLIRQFIKEIKNNPV